MKRLWGYLKKYKWFMIIGPFFKLIETVLELLNPIIVAKIIDVGIVNSDLHYVIRYCLLIFGLNIIGFVCALICQKCASLTAVGVSTSLRKDVFEKISTFSHPELDKFGTASLINRMIDDINRLENSISTVIRTIIRVPFLLIGAFVLSLIINPKMSLVFLVLIPVVCIILVIYTKKTSPHFKIIREKLDSVSRLTKENLSGTRVIRAFNKQEDERKRFEAASGDYTKTCIKISKISSLLSPVVFTIVDVATLAILAIGAWQINIGSLTQGDVIALIDYVSIITISLLLMSQIIVMIVRTGASVHRVNEVFDTVPSIQEKENALHTNRLSYDALMEFNDVSFNYSLTSAEKSFIKDLSFKIYPWQTIGIIGGTGSGKTTIASLMARFYDCTTGEILFKGKNIKDISIADLRKDISIVQQRSTLFSGSLRENMQIRKKNATDEEIIEALKISQAWPFVSEWRNGLDYQIMAGGKNVSGGQMQRLTIARALIGKPDLIILDDSSSALDFMTEKNLRKGISTLNSTLVIVSQRATSIQNADLIIVLDNGNVVGMGKHAELMKKCDIYKEIYDSQSK